MYPGIDLTPDEHQLNKNGNGSIPLAGSPPSSKTGWAGMEYVPESRRSALSDEPREKPLRLLFLLRPGTKNLPGTSLDVSKGCHWRCQH